MSETPGSVGNRGWMQETGFTNAQSCLEFTFQKLKLTNLELAPHGVRIEMKIIDACFPDEYSQGKSLLLTNNQVMGNLESSRYELFPSSWYGLYAGTENVESCAITHKFNCFINRMDPSRQSWLYQLVRSNIFDQGLISFNMDIGYGSSENDAHKLFEQQFQDYLKIFQPEHDHVKSLVPYRNFDVSLNQAIMQTEFSIVLETYFDRNNIITFSEKIFRCLKLPRPWLLFAMKDAVKYLRDLGFDVLDDIVNHDYDLVESGIERQRAILNQAEIMCHRQLTNDQISRCIQAAEHNNQLLFKLLETFRVDVDTAFNNAVTKCLKL